MVSVQIEIGRRRSGMMGRADDPGLAAAVLEEAQSAQAGVRTSASQVGEAAQLGGDPLVGGLPARGGETEELGALEEDTDLLQTLESLGFERHDHPPARMPVPGPP